MHFVICIVHIVQDVRVMQLASIRINWKICCIDHTKICVLSAEQVSSQFYSSVINPSNEINIYYLIHM